LVLFWGSQPQIVITWNNINQKVLAIKYSFIFKKKITWYKENCAEFVAEAAEGAFKEGHIVRDVPSQDEDVICVTTGRPCFYECSVVWVIDVKIRNGEDAIGMEGGGTHSASKQFQTANKTCKSKKSLM
jgi:hypothetical protein